LKIVVIISADAEWRTTKELFTNLNIQKSLYGEFAEVSLQNKSLTLFHGGWGKISAAASVQYVIDKFQPDLIVNLGTCGGFAGRIETGTTILVERTLVYDIVEQMGDGEEAIAFYGTSLDLGWLPVNLPHPVSRGLLISADRDILAEEIPLLIEKYEAVAADWESGAIAWVAERNKTRLLILRTVSDLVGGDGGEVYGNLELFHDRTKEIMKNLIDQLPDWLTLSDSHF